MVKRKRDERIPITILSGFLGAGKTTIVNQLVSKCDNIAVIVNDMSVINIDAALIKRNSEDVIELTNGCICCTLRKDLLDTLQELCNNINNSDKAKTILIESTGIAEPIHIAETIALCEKVPSGEGLSSKIRIDAMITVVDCASFFQFFRSASDASSTEGIDAHNPSHTAVVSNKTDKKPACEETDDRTINDLLVDQIQFANIVIINKIDLLLDQHLNVLRDVNSIVKQLNPYAKVLQSSQGNINPKLLLNTNLYQLKEMMERHEFFATEWYDVVVPESEEYGIGSFVYTSRKPFNKQKICELLVGKGAVLNDEGFITSGSIATSNVAGNTSDNTWENIKKNVIVRGKGFLWLGDDMDAFYLVHITGSTVTISKGDAWWAVKYTKEELLNNEHKQQQSESSDEGSASLGDSDDDDSDEESDSECESEDGDDDAFKREVLDTWDPEFGDRKQTLVIIGMHLTDDLKKQITTCLDNCCMSDEEISSLRSKMNVKTV